MASSSSFRANSDKVDASTFGDLESALVHGAVIDCRHPHAIRAQFWKLFRVGADDETLRRTCGGSEKSGVKSGRERATIIAGVRSEERRVGKEGRGQVVRE